MKITFPAILTVTALLLASCGGSAAGSSGQTKEQTGSAVSQTEETAQQPEDTTEPETTVPPDTAAQMPESVAAVSKSIGELWLLSGGQLAGITSDGLSLPGIGEDTVSIGTISKPNLETILSLSPDMVMLSEDIPSQKEIEQPLADAGITVYPVDINSFSDYEDVMKDLTGMTGREDLYKTNVTDVADRIDQIKAEAADLPEASYLALRISATKSKALKNDSFVTGVLDDLRMNNLASDTSALNELSVEGIANLNPDYLFVVYSGDETESESIYNTLFASNPLWQNLTAVKNNHVFHLPKDLFQYKPNARWDEAYEYIYDIRKS
ncbi:ABC transporter substrate-binding protein [Clostridium vitabionis]|uniref:ABC transporter substrate-binding protein n=1 Tax=Clostridium vitabionis TaxID=2784388 RepID=UPI00188D3210|nr:ABC transporter substrate-binding protein [Clostridium vitabionis]